LPKDVQYIISTMALKPLKGFEQLRTEVSEGRSLVVRLSEHKILRVVSVIALSISNENDAILTQVGDRRDSGGELRPVCRLPGRKANQRETVQDSIEYLLQTRLLAMKGKIDLHGCEQSDTEAESVSVGVRTRYIRTVCHGWMREGHFIEEPVCLYRPVSHGTRSMSSLAGITDLAGLNDLEAFVQKPVYAFWGEEDVLSLFAWLQPEEIQLLESTSGERILNEWVTGLTLPSPTSRKSLTL